MCWNPTYVILLFGCTLITFTDGLFIDIARKENEQNIEKRFRHTGPKIVYVIITLLTVIAVLAWRLRQQYALSLVCCRIQDYTRWIMDNTRHIWQIMG